MNSTLTEGTKTTPSQQPRKLNANSDKHDSREQEEQKEGEDAMEVESYGTKIRITRRRIYQIAMQLWQMRVAQMNTKERIVGLMEIMTISTTKAKEAQRGAKIKKKEEEWGRGRGRYHLSIQDDKRGRGGTHSQATKGSNIDTSHNNTNIIVVHQKDDTAQSRGENEQEPKANGKSDNVSTSLRQTGAQEDAAG